LQINKHKYSQQQQQKGEGRGVELRLHKRAMVIKKNYYQNKLQIVFRKCSGSIKKKSREGSNQ